MKARKRSAQDIMPISYGPKCECLIVGSDRLEGCVNEDCGGGRYLMQMTDRHPDTVGGAAMTTTLKSDKAHLS